MQSSKYIGGGETGKMVSLDKKNLLYKNTEIIFLKIIFIDHHYVHTCTN